MQGIKRKIDVEIKYKLVSQDYKTYGNTDWTTNEWKSAEGNRGLCTSGCFHAYESPELALFMNPIHADIENPRMLEVEVKDFVANDGTKIGYRKMRRIREITFVVPTVEQRVKFAIYAAKEVYKDSNFVIWANNWISGKDRSTEAARAAEAAASWAARDAARAAAWAAKSNLDLNLIAKQAMEK